MKVKVDMRFRGRMMTRQEVGRQIMNQFLDELAKDEETGYLIEKRPSMEGNTMSLILAPKKKKQRISKEELTMPKMKSHRGLNKRVKKTGSGKLKRHHAYIPPFPRQDQETAPSPGQERTGEPDRLQAHQVAAGEISKGGIINGKS